MVKTTKSIQGKLSVISIRDYNNFQIADDTFISVESFTNEEIAKLIDEFNKQVSILIASDNKYVIEALISQVNAIADKIFDLKYRLYSQAQAKKITNKQAEKKKPGKSTLDYNGKSITLDSSVYQNADFLEYCNKIDQWNLNKEEIESILAYNERNLPTSNFLLVKIAFAAYCMKTIESTLTSEQKKIIGEINMDLLRCWKSAGMRGGLSKISDKSKIGTTIDMMKANNIPVPKELQAMYDSLTDDSNIYSERKADSIFDLNEFERAYYFIDTKNEKITWMLANGANYQSKMEKIKRNLTQNE